MAPHVAVMDGKRQWRIMFGEQNSTNVELAGV